MPDTICPSLFFVRMAHPADEGTVSVGLFKPDRFEILNNETLTHVKEIIADTGEPLAVRLLCCHHVKNCTEKNYCITQRKNPDARRLICDETAGNKTQFIHLHIKPERIEYEYLMAFLEGSDFNDNRDCLVSELINTINWLKISNTNVCLNIFTFGAPVFTTSNISYLDDCIDKVNLKKNIDCDIKHISNASNGLTISTVKGELAFTDSLIRPLVAPAL